MRPLLAAIIMLGFASRGLRAQSLDIGGVELQLGQDAPEALQSLSPYKVQYDQSSKAWFVTQKVGDKFQWLSHLGATDGRISLVSNGFPLPDEMQTPRVYTDALREVRRRGGSKCERTEVEMNDDLVHQIEMRCGVYKLTYAFPWRSDVAPVDAGIYITLRVPRTH